MYGISTVELEDLEANMNRRTEYCLCENMERNNIEIFGFCKKHGAALEALKNTLRNRLFSLEQMTSIVTVFQ